MKKTIAAMFTIVLPFGICFSQDVIMKKDGEDIQAKILKVGPDEVEYKKHDNPDGPTYSVLKSDILLIEYENGTKDIFEEQVKKSRVFNNELFMKGQSDALLYYRGYTGAGTGTLLTGLLSPLVGLVPAIACSSTPPKDHNLNYPSAELITQPPYYEGYKLQAKKIKKGKVWTNWGIAFGVNVLAVLIITSGQQ